MRILVLEVVLLLALWGAEVGEGAVMRVTNGCKFTIWPASLHPNGGSELPTGSTWTFNVPAGTQSGRIWARTNCTWTFGNASSSLSPACSTGDCNGALSCGLSGEPPSTLVEYTLGAADGDGQDFYDVSLVDGFNVAVSVKPSEVDCKEVACAADLNSMCPQELRLPGAPTLGCRSACAAFPDNDRYCCRGTFGSGPSSCRPSRYSQLFKNACPDAFSYAFDDQTSTFTCPTGSDYHVVFCP